MKKDEEIGTLKRQLRYLSEQTMQKEDQIRDLEIRASILEEQVEQDNKSKTPLIDIDNIVGSNYS